MCHAFGPLRQVGLSGDMRGGLSLLSVFSAPALAYAAKVQKKNRKKSPREQRKTTTPKREKKEENSFEDVPSPSGSPVMASPAFTPVIDLTPAKPSGPVRPPQNGSSTMSLSSRPKSRDTEQRETIRSRLKEMSLGVERPEQEEEDNDGKVPASSAEDEVTPQAEEDEERFAKFRDARKDSLSKLLKERYPQIFAELIRFDKGVSVDKDIVNIDSGYHAFWKCSDCRGEFRKSVIERAFLTQECPLCVRAEQDLNTLEVRDSELASQWNPKRNSPAHHPSKVVMTSKIPIQWVCGVCQHEWTATIGARQKRRQCPQCDPVGRWMTLHPEIAKEWHPLRNHTSDATAGIKKTPVWWLCTGCGNEYEARIEARIKGEAGCPSCLKTKRREESHSVA